jgi:hypothetical protein
MSCAYAVLQTQEKLLQVQLARLPCNPSGFIDMLLVSGDLSMPCTAPCGPRVNVVFFAYHLLLICRPVCRTTSSCRPAHHMHALNQHHVY